MHVLRRISVTSSSSYGMLFLAALPSSSISTSSAAPRIGPGPGLVRSVRRDTSRSTSQWGEPLTPPVTRLESSLHHSAIVLAGTRCSLKMAFVGSRSWLIFSFPSRISFPTAQIDAKL